MIATLPPPAESTGKELNPSADEYIPVHQHLILVDASKNLLPPPLLKFLPRPFHYLPPPSHFLSAKRLPHAPTVLRHPIPIVWAPFMTHAAYPPTILTGSGKDTAAQTVKSVPDRFVNPPAICDSQVRDRRPTPPARWRALPPRLQVRASASKWKFWRRKCGTVAPVPEKAESVDYPFGDSTTVMVRNIPNRLRQNELVSLLADHCLEMNKAAPTKSEFDLVYLPVDFNRLGNKGYAFVNFTSAAGAAGLYHAWNNLGWEKFGYQTKKTRLITTAKIQGKEKLKAHLERSLFECDTDDYLAVELTPPCNGSNLSAVAAATVGSRIKAVERRRMTVGVGRRLN